MKQNYTHLKLIIEAPTQDAWDKVTEFFGLEINALWHRHGEKTAVCFPSILSSAGYAEALWYKTQDLTDFFIEHEYLTYPEFIARFLEPKPVSLEQVKDEYAQQDDWKNWASFIEILGMVGKTVDNNVTAIATRYASAITEEIKSQHDKEMIEFAEWVGDNCKKERVSWEYFGDGPAYSTAELLQLFRNRNK